MPLSAESNWTSNVFASGGFSPYFLPEELSSMAVRGTEFRASAGYTFRVQDFDSFSFPVYFESGYTHIVGKNPLILDIKAVPVSVFFEADYSFLNNFSLFVSCSCGALFSEAMHYKTVIDMKKEQNLYTDSGCDFFIGIRGGLSLDTLYRNACVRLSGGLDLVLESDGPIPLPLVSVGVRLYPFGDIKLGKERIVEKEKTVTETVEITKTVEVSEYFADRTILFMPEQVSLGDEAVATLKKLGEHLKKYPAVKLELTGYAAPYGSKSEQLEIAQKRSEVVKEYLVTNFGIAPERILVRKSKIASEDSKDSENELIQLRSVVCHVYE